MNLIDDDDSENDSDYVPEEDPNYIPDTIEEQKQEITNITFGRRRKAQELWDEIQREDQQFIQSTLSRAVSYNSKYYNVEYPMKKTLKKLFRFFKGNKTKRNKSNNNKNTKEEIEASSSSFQPSVLSNGQKDDKNSDQVENKKSSSSKKRLREEVEEVDGEKDSKDEEEREGEKQSIRQKALEAISRIKKKTKVEEVQKFAGQAIVVEKVVLQSSEDRSEIEKKAVPKSSVDKVLEAIKGPKGINTVQKSSADWSNFKEKEGIQDELAEGAAKNAYLDRKNFLERCDYRAFEKERDERLQAISKRMN